jgi:hypothetical protein
MNGLRRSFLCRVKKSIDQHHSPQVKKYQIPKYRIAGNFNLVRFLIWRFGEFGIDCQIKNSPIYLNAYAPMAVNIQIAKLKIRQYQWRAISLNLMLAKVPAIQYNCILM